ncbi:MAG TPA: ComF family protein [Pyrinomonadaceae bacterium]|nr:ComF family protein [Pyrinomonadaceae bacterium]
MNVGLSILDRAFDAALALVYPQACAICGRNVESRRDGVVCDTCWKTTNMFSESDLLCWKCGALSLASVPEAKRRQVRCGRCDDDAYTFARACGSYDGALRASILQLKRQAHVPARLLSLIREIQRREPLNGAEVIVPVPLHESRERERGFNQSAVIARELARVTKLPLDEHSFVRRVHTERHRAGMDARARRQSVEGAFVLRRNDLIAGKRVLLVDDVFTTGATVSACAETLTRADAAEVLVLTVARARAS